MDVSWERVGCRAARAGPSQTARVRFWSGFHPCVVESVSRPRPRERDPLQASLLPRARAPRPSVR